jgi:hypothetical protein
MQEATGILAALAAPLGTGSMLSAEVGSLIRTGVAALLASPWPVPATAALVPVGLALASRSAFAVAACLLLVPLSVAALAQGDGPVLGAALYAAAVLLAGDGLRGRGRRRRFEQLTEQVARIHRELDGFLSALERRAETLDARAAGDRASDVAGERMAR